MILNSSDPKEITHLRQFYTSLGPISKTKPISKKRIRADDYQLQVLIEAFEAPAGMQIELEKAGEVKTVMPGS